MNRTDARGRLGGIEAARGIAATLVVLYHAARHLDKVQPNPLLTELFQFGHAGVDIFFVISGFIILHVHRADIGRPDRLRHYAARRFSRVFPTYWVALAITVALGLASHDPIRPSMGQLVTSVCLWPANAKLLLGIAWTLQYEIFFYAVFATLILRREWGVAILTMWFVAICLNLFGLGAGFAPGPVTGAYNLEFFAGMAVARLAGGADIAAPRALLAGGIAAFAMVAVAEDVGWLDGYGNLARLAYGLPAACIVLGSATAGLAPPAWLRALGAASYSVYLFQFLCIGAAWQCLTVLGGARALPVAVEFAALAASAVAGGVLLSRGIEYRLIRAIRNPTRPAPT